MLRRSVRSLKVVAQCRRRVELAVVEEQQLVNRSQVQLSGPRAPDSRYLERVEMPDRVLFVVWVPLADRVL